MRIVFVKRGAYSTYRVLQEQCAALSDVDIRWDRRCGEDRRRRTVSTTGDRRNRDRRTTPSSDWTLLGYTVVDLTGDSRGPGL